MPKRQTTASRKNASRKAAARKTAAPAAVRTSPAAVRTSPSADQIPPPADDRVLASNLTLHELFQQQTRAMLESADLDDEQKQSILVAMSCPCCGAGGFSLTAKLKRRT